MGNGFLAVTGELPLSDEAWDALLPRWDGCAMLLLPPEHMPSAGDAREARLRAKANAFADLSKCLWCAGPWNPHAACAFLLHLFSMRLLVDCVQV